MTHFALTPPPKREAIIYQLCIFSHRNLNFLNEPLVTSFEEQECKYFHKMHVVQWGWQSKKEKHSQKNALIFRVFC